MWKANNKNDHVFLSRSTFADRKCLPETVGIIQRSEAKAWLRHKCLIHSTVERLELSLVIISDGALIHKAKQLPPALGRGSVISTRKHFSILFVCKNLAVQNWRKFKIYGKLWFSGCINFSRVDDAVIKWIENVYSLSNVSARRANNKTCFSAKTEVSDPLKSNHVTNFLELSHVQSATALRIDLIEMRSPNNTRFEFRICHLQ